MTFEILQSPEIWHRGDFPILCIWRQLKRIVEVGVDRAEFSQIFLQRAFDWIDVYLGVDSFAPYGEMPWSREGDLQVASIRYERFAAKAKLIKENSSYAAEYLEAQKGKNRLWGDPFDFIYIDGDHSEGKVTDDILRWWPFLSGKGILAGHDWGGELNDHPHVQKEVIQFAREHHLAIYHTYDDDPQSWYIYKNGIPGPEFRRGLDR